jgi:hypothetical protein
MTHPAKRKGDAAELEAARHLADLTGWPIRRKLGAGRTDDTGDLDGLPDCTVGVKAYRDIQRAVRETLDELPIQQANAGTTFAFGYIRRPGGRWFAILTDEQITCLLREASRPIPETSLRQLDYLRRLENEVKAWREQEATA